MLNYAEFLSSAEFGNSAEFRNSSEFTNSPKFRISGLQKFGRIRDIDWITRNSFLRSITRNGSAFQFHFPLFSILFAACFLQNTLRFFLEGYVLFFAVFLRLTVHIVVFGGSLPFGPATARPPGKSSRLPATARRRLQLGRKKTGAVLLGKAISGSGEKAYWLISKKSDFFEAPGIISAKISQSGSFLEKIIISTCWGENPEIWVFGPRRKKLFWLIFRKIWVLFARQWAPKFARFCFPRPPRSRYKARCNHIRDLLRDETFFAVDAVCYGSACYFSVFSRSPLFTFFRLVCDLRPTVHTVVFLAATYRSRCF